MKKVLFCVHDFPGTGGGGCFNLVKYLPRYGYLPIVLTNTHRHSEVEKRLLNSLDASVRIYETSCISRSPFRVFSKLFGWPRLAGFLDRLVFMPDICVTGLVPAAVRAIRLVRAQKVECIITSSPPESFHLIGLLTKKLTGCKWVGHFRDLWTTKSIAHPAATPVHSWTQRKLERFVYQRVDHLVANTYGNRDVYTTSFQVPVERITVITNGYDATESLRCASAHADMGSRVFRLGYLGYFDKPHFPWQQFLVALNGIAKPAPPGSLELRIAGYVSETARAFIERNGMFSFVKLYGVLSHSEAYALIAQSDVNIVLHYETGYSKAIVPHKLYHYLGMHKPILGIGEEDGEMASIIKETKVGRTVSIHNEGGVHRELLSLFNEWQKNGQIGYMGEHERIERYEIQALTRLLAETIREASATHMASGKSPLRGHPLS
jgi:glycosyltransferase involved in cell wall biosynthesis